MRLSGLWRHPVKGIGREALERVELAAGRPLPGDRAWAVLHEGAPDEEGWHRRGDFLVVAKGPGLAAVTAETDGDAVVLRHPERAEGRFRLPQDGPALIDWARPLWPGERPTPHRLIAAPPEGMGDNGMASVAILTESSLAALSEAAGQALDIGRFRGNLILSGTAPWEEFTWYGKHLRVGGALLDVLDPIGRCRATEANPATGDRDVNMLAVLRDHFGHTDFGMYARVVESGPVGVGDRVDLA